MLPRRREQLGVIQEALRVLLSRGDARKEIGPAGGFHGPEIHNVSVARRFGDYPGAPGAAVLGASSVTGRPAQDETNVGGSNDRRAARERTKNSTLAG